MTSRNGPASVAAQEDEFHTLRCVTPTAGQQVAFDRIAHTDSLPCQYLAAGSPGKNGNTAEPLVGGSE